MTSSFPPEPYGSETNKYYTKTAIRREILLKRQKVEHRYKAALSICEQVIATPEWQASKSIGMYWPKADELNTIPLINAALSQSKLCFLPKMTNSEMMFYEFNSMLELEIKANSIMEPRTRKSLVPELLIVPCLAVNSNGHRVGYGKGIYDRYLSKNITKTIIVAYDFQKIENFYVDEFDQRCNKVILSHP